MINLNIGIQTQWTHTKLKFPRHLANESQNVNLIAISHVLEIK